ALGPGSLPRVTGRGQRLLGGSARISSGSEERPGHHGVGDVVEEPARPIDPICSTWTSRSSPIQPVRTGPGATAFTRPRAAEFRALEVVSVSSAEASMGPDLPEAL